MKKTNKAVKYILISIALIVIILSVAANALVKTVIVYAVKNQTGQTVEIGSLKMGKLSSWFEIGEFKLLNPPGYPETPALVINRLYVEYSPASIFSDEVVIKNLQIDISQILMVEKAGRSNFDGLIEGGAKAIKKTSEKAASSPEPPQKKSEARTIDIQSHIKSGGKNVQIQNLELKLGTMELHRWISEDAEPVIQKFVFDETYVFTNLTSPEVILQRLAASFFVKQMAGELLEP